MVGQVSEKLKSRFMSCADGDTEENARLKRENLRSVLECTDAWTEVTGCVGGFQLFQWFCRTVGVKSCEVYVCFLQIKGTKVETYISIHVWPDP